MPIPEPDPAVFLTTTKIKWIFFLKNFIPNLYISKRSLNFNLYHLISISGKTEKIFLKILTYYYFSSQFYKAWIRIRNQESGSSLRTYPGSRSALGTVPVAFDVLFAGCNPCRWFHIQNFPGLGRLIDKFWKNWSLSAYANGD